MGGNVRVAPLILNLNSSRTWVMGFPPRPRNGVGLNTWRWDKPSAYNGNRTTIPRTSNPYPRHLPLLASIQQSTSYCQAVVATPRSTIDPHTVYPCLAWLCDRERTAAGISVSVTSHEVNCVPPMRVKYFGLGWSDNTLLLVQKSRQFSFFIL